MKKIMSICLIIVLLMNFIPMKVIAATQQNYEVSDTINATLSSDGVLTISGSGEMPDYTERKLAPWNGENIKKVIVEKGITVIGNYAFYNNLSAADKDAIIADQTYGKIVQDLVAGAVANQNNYTQVSGSQDINVDTSNITYTMTGDYIETSVIKPTSSNQSFKSYTVQINNSVGNIEIVDENNNPIAGTYINANQGFKLRVPASEVQNENFKANITIVGYFEDFYDAFVYMPNPSYHEKLSGIRSEGTCENESPKNLCFENKEACTSAGNVFDEETRKCSVKIELQRALLGKIESPSTPTTIDLEVPTIDVPDTNSTSYIVYGIGALIIIAGIVLIVMAKGPKNAKKK